MNPIIEAWIQHLQSEEVAAFVEQFGNTRRVDITLYSDRGRTPKPPTLLAKLGRDNDFAENADDHETGISETVVT